MPQLADDDVYINAGDSYDIGGDYYPDVPEERKEAERIAKGITAASYPVMDSVSDWFQEAIEKCPNISNVQVEAIERDGVIFSRKVSVEAQVLAYQLLQELLMDKANEFSEWGKDRS